MEKALLFFCLILFSCSQTNQVHKTFISQPKVLVSIKDSLDKIIFSDTLFWQKLSTDEIADSSVFFLKSDSLFIRKHKPNPFGPPNNIPFDILSKQLTVFKIVTPDSFYAKTSFTFNKGSYCLELFDYKKSGGIYGIYFENNEQRFKDKLLLIK